MNTFLVDTERGEVLDCAKIQSITLRKSDNKIVIFTGDDSIYASYTIDEWKKLAIKSDNYDVLNIVTTFNDYFLADYEKQTVPEG